MKCGDGDDDQVPLPSILPLGLARPYTRIFKIKGEDGSSPG